MAAEPAATGLRPETERRLQSPTPCAEPQHTMVILGDSIVYGWGLPYEASYPRAPRGYDQPEQRVTLPLAGDQRRYPR